LKGLDLLREEEKNTGTLNEQQYASKCLEPHYLPIRKENFLSISTLWFTPTGSSGLFVEREGLICKYK
jgi:hypothetical protein